MLPTTTTTTTTTTITIDYHSYYYYDYVHYHYYYYYYHYCSQGGHRHGAAHHNLAHRVRHRPPPGRQDVGGRANKKTQQTNTSKNINEQHIWEDELWQPKLSIWYGMM